MHLPSKPLAVHSLELYDRTSYEPPNGYKPLSSDPECSHFDWDTVNNDPNLEIWAIRLPSNVCTYKTRNFHHSDLNT